MYEKGKSIKEVRRNYASCVTCSSDYVRWLSARHCGCHN